MALNIRLYRYSISLYTFISFNIYKKNEGNKFIRMEAIKDDEALFEEFRLMKKAREHLQELTATEKVALQAIGINILRNPKTGENVVVE